MKSRLFSTTRDFRSFEKRSFRRLRKSEQANELDEKLRQALQRAFTCEHPPGRVRSQLLHLAGQTPVMK